MERLTGRTESGHAYIIGCPEFEAPRIAVRDHFFCRRNRVCFEACSLCEANGDCDMCASFGQPDRCQMCTRYYGPGSIPEESGDG